MNAELIKKLLRARHSDQRQWIYFEECPVGTGYKGAGCMDGYAIAVWPSEQNKRIAYEIKCSRADFLNEIKKPTKRRAALYFSNEFYFVAPRGMIKPEEVPIECGLQEVDPEGSGHRITTKVAAPLRDTIRPTWNFTAALIRRAAYDTEIRVHASRGPEGEGA
jgi:hypothetical protein